MLQEWFSAPCANGVAPLAHDVGVGPGWFTRPFRLPAFLDHDKASVAHKNGMLTITFFKREEAKCRRIMVEGL